MRTGILGGTFDPFHNGHLALAMGAKEEYLLDRVLVMPSGISYLKAGTNVSDSRIRGEMTALAIRGHEGLVLDDREMRREGNTYTCDTIRELAAEGVYGELFFIVGADSLLGMQGWKRADLIFGGCTVLAARRSGREGEDSRAVLEEAVEKLRAEYGARIGLLSMSLPDISSTLIRDRVKKGRSISGLVAPAVERYIFEKGLYMSSF